MKHLVLMKFENGYFNDTVFFEIRDTFAALQKEMSREIISCNVRKNCVERDTNMDVLIEMELKDASSLGKYLGHPLHVGIGKKMNSHMTGRCSFDYKQ